MDQAKRRIEDAAKQGAGLVVLPENFALMAMSEQERVKHAEAPGKGVIQKFLASQAKKHGIWLVGGTIPLEASEKPKSRSPKNDCAREVGFPARDRGV